MATHRPPDLRRLAAEHLAAHLDRVPVGSSFVIDSSAALCDVLELLVPESLRPTNPEWQKESIDGFFFASAVKTGEGSAEMAGTCILISDQSVTPFALSVSLADNHRIETLRVRLGEPGGGRLGISGPACNSRAGEELLQGLVSRLGDVRWKYDVDVT